MSILTVNVGSMFSGKSTLLIQQGEKHAKAGQKVLYIKPSFDDRYSKTEIVTHSGIKVPAMVVDKREKLSQGIFPHEVDVVLIDEVQFFDKRICDEVLCLLYRGIKVYASGLDLTFNSDGFETVAELMCLADKVNKLKAVCGGCGGDSVVSGLKHTEDSTEVIKLGAEEKYIPLCRRCYYKHITRGKDYNEHRS